MPFAAVGAWLGLGVVLGVLCAAPGSLRQYRWPAALLITAACGASLAWAWSTLPAPFPHSQGALVFDHLSGLLLPALWAGMALAMLVCLFLPDPRYELPFAAVAISAATAGIMSASPLLTVMLLQACALLTLAGLVVRAERPGGNSVLSIATALKYVTLTVISAACLAMGLLLNNFYALNQDRLELPRIIVALLVVGFGLAAGLMPFYFYLPDLFDAAPIATSLSYVGPLQCLAFVFLIRCVGNGPWLLADDHVVAVLAFGALGGALLASVLAFGQRNIRRVLAFNVVRETGWLAFGLASATRAGWSGLLVLLLARCIAQPLLLSALGVLESKGPAGLLPAGGLLRLFPVASLSWCIGALATIGVPPTANFWGLADLVRGGLSVNSVAVTLLLLSALLGLWRLGYAGLALLWGRSAPAPLAFRSISTALGEAGESEAVAPEREPPVLAWLLGFVAVGLLVGGLAPRLFSVPVSNTLAAFAFLR